MNKNKNQFDYKLQSLIQMRCANSDPVHRPMHALNARRKEETANFETKDVNIVVLE